MFGGFINPPLGGGDRGGFKGAQPPSAARLKRLNTVTIFSKTLKNLKNQKVIIILYR